MLEMLENGLQVLEISTNLQNAVFNLTFNLIIYTYTSVET